MKGEKQMKWFIILETLTLLIGIIIGIVCGVQIDQYLMSV